jgi:hypothetical protein
MEIVLGENKEKLIQVDNFSNHSINENLIDDQKQTTSIYNRIFKLICCRKEKLISKVRIDDNSFYKKFTILIEKN